MDKNSYIIYWTIHIRIVNYTYKYSYRGYMAKLKESINTSEQLPEEVLLSEEDRIAIVADLMFEIIIDQLAEEDVECPTN